MLTTIYNATEKRDMGTWINKVGKYLKQHIDGAYKIKFNAMNCEVWMRMYYQVPRDLSSFREIHFLIDITSYQNKLRVNLIEDTAMEKTVGQVILKPEELTDLESVKAKILEKIQRFIAKEYADYEFVY